MVNERREDIDISPVLLDISIPARNIRFIPRLVSNQQNKRYSPIRYIPLGKYLRKGDVIYLFQSLNKNQLVPEGYTSMEMAIAHLLCHMHKIQKSYLIGHNTNTRLNTPRLYKRFGEN